MAQDLDFLQNTISTQEEMLAYETLWAIKNISGKELRERLTKDIPSKVLKKITESKQLDVFSAKNSYDQIKIKVESFLKKFLKDKWNRPIGFGGNFQYSRNSIDDYPMGWFYYKGELNLLEERCIAITGTSKASPEGISKAKELAKELADKNFVIVSDLSIGIDTEVHQSAIDAMGYTIAVIGTPINEYYPKENQRLQDQIAKDFLLISQVPFYKYVHEPFGYRTYHFQNRNKTIASISEAIVIVEVSDYRESYILAKECLKQNKKLFIMDSCFKNKQINWIFDYEKKGAIRIKNTSDILKHLNKNQKMSFSWRIKWRNFPKKSDDICIFPHYYPEYINAKDICIYFKEYVSKGRSACIYSSEYVLKNRIIHTNSQIFNFKKSQQEPFEKTTLEWRNRQQKKVVNKIKEDIEELFKKDLSITITSIPSSKHKTHPEYDNRFENLFKELLKSRPSLNIEWPIEIKSSHSKGLRKPESIKSYYTWKGFKKAVPEVLFVFDDILTKGAHFRAVSDFLKENGYKGQIIGIFLSRTIRKY